MHQSGMDKVRAQAVVLGVMCTIAALGGANLSGCSDPPGGNDNSNNTNDNTGGNDNNNDNGNTTDLSVSIDGCPEDALLIGAEIELTAMVDEAGTPDSYSYQWTVSDATSARPTNEQTITITLGTHDVQAVVEVTEDDSGSTARSGSASCEIGVIAEIDCGTMGERCGSDCLPGGDMVAGDDDFSLPLSEDLPKVLDPSLPYILVVRDQITLDLLVDVQMIVPIDFEAEEVILFYTPPVVRDDCYDFEDEYCLSGVVDLVDGRRAVVVGFVGDTSDRLCEIALTMTDVRALVVPRSDREVVMALINSDASVSEVRTPLLGSVGFSDVENYGNFAITEAGTWVVTAESEWLDLWEKYWNVFDGEGQKTSPPDIDFESHMVLGVTWGGDCDYSGCTNMSGSIEAVASIGDQIQVTVGALADLGPCDACVQPLHLVTVNKSELAVTFVGEVPGED